MIDLEDLNPRKFPLTDGQLFCLYQLRTVLRELEVVSGLEMKITSGMRSLERHLKIYADKGIPENKVPMGSAHLRGLAADLADADHKWKKWFFEIPGTKKNPTWKLTEQGDLFLKKNECYLEHPAWTSTWLHLQLLKPKSGSLVFIP
jgi:hypothetical protein